MSSRLIFLPEAWDDYVYWQEQDRKTLRKINSILKDICRDALEGTGKPEPLKGDMSGWWSRRIDDANRHLTKKICRCTGSLPILRQIFSFCLSDLFLIG